MTTILLIPSDENVAAVLEGRGFKVTKNISEAGLVAVCAGWECNYSCEVTQARQMGKELVSINLLIEAGIHTEERID